MIDEATCEKLLEILELMIKKEKLNQEYKTADQEPSYHYTDQHDLTPLLMEAEEDIAERVEYIVKNHPNLEFPFQKAFKYILDYHQFSMFIREAAGLPFKQPKLLDAYKMVYEEVDYLRITKAFFESIKDANTEPFLSKALDYLCKLAIVQLGQPNWYLVGDVDLEAISPQYSKWIEVYAKILLHLTDFLLREKDLDTSKKYFDQSLGNLESLFRDSVIGLYQDIYRGIMKELMKTEFCKKLNLKVFAIIFSHGVENFEGYSWEIFEIMKKYPHEEWSEQSIKLIESEDPDFLDELGIK